MTLQQEVLGTIRVVDVVWPLLLHAASMLGVLLALLLITQILRSRRMPSASVGWLVVILFVPVIGIPLYLAFGTRKLKSRLANKQRLALPENRGVHDHPVHLLLTALGVPCSSTGNHIRFHADGSVAWSDLQALVEAARQRIDVAVFVLADDSVGRDLLARLEQKAAQGVRVRLLLDWVGSFLLPKKRLAALRANGGEVAWFIPLLHPPLRERTNLRNHRKMVVIDEQTVWTGGRNLARSYLGDDCPQSCWCDLSFSVQGPAVAAYGAIFEADWQFARRAASAVAATQRPREARGELALKAESGLSRIQVLPSGPDMLDDPLYAALLTSCYQAQRSITAVSPYYVPDAGFQEALRLAVLRGVAVNLVLPQRSNHLLADIARQRYLRELAAAGARIWLLPQAMLHAKVFIVDDQFAMAGSANLDIRSLFLNFEVMSCFYSAQDVAWLAAWAESVQARSVLYTYRRAGALRELLEGFVLLTAYQL